jgi:diadenosine tetraphosphate (Ap4A) HIT family hydrolase
MPECPICRRETAADEPLGGWVLRTDLWSVCVAEGFEVPGWLFLELRRHAEGPMSLTPEEASELGPLLAAVSGAVQAATGAERVYVLAFGELFPHFHLLVAPRMPMAPPEHTGPHLFLNRSDLVDRDRAADTALAICRQLASS